MNKKIFTLISLSLTGLVISGCSSMSLNNRSLDYKNAKSQPVLVVPDGLQMRQETPLFPAPIVEDEALANAPTYANQRGNRYELPRPQMTNSTANTTTASTQLENLRPHFIYDANKNPLLQIAGDTQQIWRYVEATVSSLNYKTQAQSGKTMMTFDKDGQQYLLYLSQVGATNVLAVYEATGNFAPQDVANEVLTQIYQNWPV